MNAPHSPTHRREELRRLLVDAVEETARAAPRKKRLALASLAGLAAIAVASVVTVGAITGSLGTSEGSGTGTSSGSRVKLYNSLAELVADSAVVAAGTVISQQTAEDGSEQTGGDFTVATFRVDQAYAPAGLGSALGQRRPAPERGDELYVRVTGTVGTVSSVAQPQLTEGQRYLLFLVPTGLPDASDQEYFITGAGAGTYVAEGDAFRRISTDGDSIPAVLTAADLAG